MSPSDAPQALSELPKTIASLTSAVPAAARAVTAASVDCWRPDSWPPVVATLQQVNFSWRIRFIQKETETFLFFIQVPKGQWVMLDATASIAVSGAWGLEPAFPLASDNLRFLARLSTFLVPNPSDDFANTYKPAGADTAQTIFFDLGGGGILAVTHPEQGQKALVRYSPGGVPGVPPKKGYPLAAFVDFSFALRDWAVAGAPVGPPVAVPASTAQPTPPQQVLNGFVQAYITTANALRGDPSAQPPFDQRFRVTKYAVSVSVALAADGSIADSSDKEASRLDLSLNAVSADPVVATATLGSANFVVTGDLYNQIFDDLGSPDQAQALGSQIGKDTVLITSFCASARASSAVFQVGTPDPGRKLLMILSGVMQGFPEIMVIRADYDGTFDFLDAREYRNDPAKTIVSFAELGHYFLPLITGIRFCANELLTW